MKGLIVRTLLSPISMVEWFCDSLINELMKVYSDSLAESGLFSIFIHKIFRGLVCLSKPWILLKTCLIPMQSSRPLPPINSTLLTYSASKLAHDIRTRKIKCEDVMTAYIQRIKDVNPILNCVVQERFEEGLKEARVMDELLTAKPNTEYWKKKKPLLGVPLTVKESIAVKGMSNNAARTHIRSNVAKEDAEAVSLLRRAGAIVILVSSTPEMCMNWETFNCYQGTTRNPYDTRRIPGGSSGGEGALLGACASVIGVGSDLAGSLRIPAFFNCIFAHKATPGFIPMTGHIPNAFDTGIYSGTWESILAIGPMSRYAQDLPLMMANMIPERNNPQTLNLDEPVDFKSLKIYYVDELNTGWSLHDPIGQEMRNALMKLIHYIKIAYNVNVEKIKLKECSDIMALSAALMLQIKVQDHIFQKDSAGDPDVWKSVPGTVVKSLFSDKPTSPLVLFYAPLTYLMKKIPDDTYKKLVAKRDRIRQQIEDCLGSDGILLVPTFPTTAPYHRRVGSQFLNSAYAILFNITGLPATECPLGLTQQGLPIGIQVVASSNQDRLCFAAAKVIQSAFGGWKTPPTSQS